MNQASRIISAFDQKKAEIRERLLEQFRLMSPIACERLTTDLCRLKESKVDRHPLEHLAIEIGWIEIDAILAEYMAELERR